MPSPETIRLARKFETFADTWSPKRVGQIDDYDVRIVKIDGAFDWHSHADADEMFYVVVGKLLMHFRDRTETVEAGELIIVPKGVEHKPEAGSSPCHLMLIEKSDVVNTGDGAHTDRTKAVEDLT